MDLLQKYDPEFKHINDTIAFAVHVSFLQQNYQLVGLNEMQFLEDIGSVPQKWNENHEIYQFRYISKKNINDKNKEQLTILIKILSMSDDEMMVSAFRQSANENIHTLDININDHIDVNNYKKDKKKTKAHYKNVDQLLLLINESITKKVIDEPKKEEEKEDKQKKKLLIDDDYNPYMDPNFAINKGGQLPYQPFGDFDRDRFPVGPIGPMGGGFGGIGGNIMGPNHPIFGQPQINKPNNVPPNARYDDPVGPGPLGKKKGPNPDHMPPPNGDDDSMFM